MIGCLPKRRMRRQKAQAAHQSKASPERKNELSYIFHSWQIIWFEKKNDKKAL